MDELSSLFLSQIFCPEKKRKTRKPNSGGRWRKRRRIVSLRHQGRSRKINNCQSSEPGLLLVSFSGLQSMNLSNLLILLHPYYLLWGRHGPMREFFHIILLSYSHRHITTCLVYSNNFCLHFYWYSSSQFYNRHIDHLWAGIWFVSSFDMGHKICGIKSHHGICNVKLIDSIPNNQIL